MCGIAGIISAGTMLVRRDLLQEMISVLAHRGPDHRDVLIDGGTGLASARLAIVDPARRSNQPLWDVTSNYAVAFNGEIYNFRELRAELSAKGHQFATHSDTEVILEAYKQWGIDFLGRLNGMWAIALWSRPERQVLLARDRFGVKPLYVYRSEGALIFASEMKAILATGVEPRFDAEAFAAFRGFRGERSILSGIDPVASGTCLMVGADAVPKSVRWWRTLDHLGAPSRNSRHRREEFRELLFDSVRLRLRSDVDVALTLSSGVDSSSIYAAVKRLQSSEPITAASSERPLLITPFVVTYPGEAIDEAAEASALARALGDVVRFVRPEPGDFRRLVEDVVWHQENPTWSPGVLAYHALYRAIASDGLKVAVEGHGSDELLGGYSTLAHAALTAAVGRGRFVAAFRAAQALARSSDSAIGQSGAPAIRHFAAAVVRRLIGQSGQRKGPSDDIFDRSLQPNLALDPGWDEETRGLTPLKRALYLSFHHGILPTMLRVFDRASMAHSVESRAPFLDYRLVTFAFSLPDEDLIGGGWTKRILRESMDGILPREVRFRQRKIPFLIPQPSWFSSASVRDALHEAEIDGTIAGAPGLDREAYRRMLQDAVVRGFDWQNTHRLWLAYSYAIWCARFLRPNVPVASRWDAGVTNGG